MIYSTKDVLVGRANAGRAARLVGSHPLKNWCVRLQPGLGVDPKMIAHLLAREHHVAVLTGEVCDCAEDLVLMRASRACGASSTNSFDLRRVPMQLSREQLVASLDDQASERASSEPPPSSIHHQLLHRSFQHCRRLD